MSMLIMGLVWWTCAPSCAHQQRRPRPHSRPLGLPLGSQTESPPWVCPLKLMFQDPATVHTSRHMSRARKWDSMAALRAGPSLCCLPASQNLHTPPEQSPGLSNSLSVPADLPAEEGGSQGERTFPPSQLPPTGTGLIPMGSFLQL